MNNMKMKNLILDEIEYVQFQKEYAAWSEQYYPWPPEDPLLDPSSADPSNYEPSLPPVAETTVQDCVYTGEVK